MRREKNRKKTKKTKKQRNNERNVKVNETKELQNLDYLSTVTILKGSIVERDALLRHVRGTGNTPSDF